MACRGRCANTCGQNYCFINARFTVLEEGTYTALEGAEFSLLDGCGRKAASATSRADGTFRFRVKLKKCTTYTIHQVAAPEGFTAMTDHYLNVFGDCSFTVDGLEAAENSVFYNAPLLFPFPSKSANAPNKAAAYQNASECVTPSIDKSISIDATGRIKAPAGALSGITSLSCYGILPATEAVDITSSIAADGSLTGISVPKAQAGNIYAFVAKAGSCEASTTEKMVPTRPLRASSRLPRLP